MQQHVQFLSYIFSLLYPVHFLYPENKGNFLYSNLEKISLGVSEINVHVEKKLPTGVRVERNLG
jgi:hypothetical protein